MNNNLASGCSLARIQLVIDISSIVSINELRSLMRLQLRLSAP